MAMYLFHMFMAFLYGLLVGGFVYPKLKKIKNKPLKKFIFGSEIFVLAMALIVLVVLTVVSLL